MNLVQQISLKDNELAAIQQENSNLHREISGLKIRLRNSQEAGSSSDIRVISVKLYQNLNLLISVRRICSRKWRRRKMLSKPSCTLFLPKEML